MALQTGLFYPLEITGSGDIRSASTVDEDLVQSWAKYILDTEVPFQTFETSNATANQIGAEKFRYSLATKCPLVTFDVSTEKVGAALIVNIRWGENESTSLTVAQGG